MRTRTIGDVQVGAIGLGGMPMSIEGRPDRERSIRTIHAALDAGVTLIDTANSYNRDAGETGHNEELIAEALRSYGPGSDDVLVATKGGLVRPGDGTWLRDGRPESLKAAAKESARRLGVEAIGLYQFHRADPKVAYTDSIGALAELLDEGVIRMAGVSNAEVVMIDAAQEVLGGRLVSVQNQFSPRYAVTVGEMRHAVGMGLAFLPWSPLGGIAKAGALGARHQAFQDVADAHGVSPQQVALAWELSLSDRVIPIPGASRPESVEDSARAASLALDTAELAVLSATVGL
ncbi:aldo/keto reductase [Demequina capsici]|uniref:Aldo/keto reductase n=1 Tax=Demequina capsici TaxID=3075620 RepID=A0AA96F5R3_9MICO|nr:MULTISPECIES: aldo/keto reductase [unclassified Demequina]WNM23839.1 aldo/keto reductase [Demequina sp. OYTSA14]WNM26678.1 aldo/keto reductase [Demequina sp. PMTSA13]